MLKMLFVVLTFSTSLNQAFAVQCSGSTLSIAGNTICKTLYAGQNIVAGEVCTSVVDENLLVNYTTINGWQLIRTHLWVGAELSSMPQTKKGSPKVGLFPYKSDDITGQTAYTFTIPLTNLTNKDVCTLCNTIFYIAAHAELRKYISETGDYQLETGWGDGEYIVDRGSWATYSTIYFVCEADVPPEIGDDQLKCETAFGTTITTNDSSQGHKSGGNPASSCFLETTVPLHCPCEPVSTCHSETLGNNWGWEVGPIVPGTYTLDLHAGAGQCDVRKGFSAGTVTITYTGSDLTVTFNESNGTTKLGTVHVNGSYDGTCVTAPGQYNFFGVSGVFADSCGKNSYTVTAHNLNGNSVYLVVHAEICPGAKVCQTN